MNAATRTKPTLPVQPSGRVGWHAGGILLAAIFCGVIFNQASPLGVKAAAPIEASVGAESGMPPSSASELEVLPASTNVIAREIAAPTQSTPVLVTMPPQFPELKWPAVKALLAANQIVLIDARLKETFALSRIPGAVSLPAYSPVEELQAFAAKYPRDTHFVIYCNSDTCDMSHDLAGKLARQFGFTNLTLMPGGFAEYLIAESAANQPPKP